MKRRKEGAFWVVQALIVVGVLALVALPSSSSSSSSSSCSASLSQISATSSSKTAGGVITQLVVGTNVNHQVGDQYGGSGVSFPYYQTIPVTVYAHSPTRISLVAVAVPSDAWLYFGGNSVTATPAGAVANITMMGVYATDPNLPESQALIIGAGSGSDSAAMNTTTFFVRPSGFPFVAVRNASTSIIPKVSGLGWDDDNSSATDPWTLVYDPSNPVCASSSLNVSLQVLGLEVNGSSVLQPMPSFLRVGFLNSTFTLNEYQPAFDAVHVRNNIVLTAIGSHESYQVAVKETVDGLSQIAHMQVDIVGPIGISG